jgi:hypothetical protein
MKKNTKRKIKNFILKAISVISAFILIISICFIDSQNSVPFYISIGISLLWLVPFGIANGVFKND